MERIYFTEEQRMNILWVKILMGVIWIGLLVFFGIAFYTQFYLGKPFGDKPVSNLGMAAIFLVVALQLAGGTWLMYSFRLITEVRDEGLFYRYPPLLSRFKKIAPGEIGEYAIRRYRPLREYGGWGIKTGSRKYGTAYNAYGNTGLQLTLSNGKKILIGTQRPDALKKAMDRMMARSNET